MTQVVPSSVVTVPTRAPLLVWVSTHESVASTACCTATYAPSGVGGAGSYENYITSESLTGFTMALAGSGAAITINWRVKGF